jgi:hypothetical protein
MTWAQAHLVGDPRVPDTSSQTGFTIAAVAGDMQASE